MPSQKSKSWLPFGGASSSPPSRTSSIESTNGTSGSDAEDEEPAISSVTAERATAAKVWLENYFEGIMRGRRERVTRWGENARQSLTRGVFPACGRLNPATNDRAARRQRLEAEMEADGLPEEQRQAMRQRYARRGRRACPRQRTGLITAMQLVHVNGCSCQAFPERVRLHSSTPHAHLDGQL